MPNFTARAFSGLAPVPWIDPPTGSAPSRLNALASHLPLYLRAFAPANLVFKAKVDGTEGPMDVDLGGELFQAWWAECSGPWPLAIVQPPGQSSVVEVAIPATHLGHFLLVLRRENGGAVLIHFDIEPVPPPPS